MSIRGSQELAELGAPKADAGRAHVGGKSRRRRWAAPPRARRFDPLGLMDPANSGGLMNPEWLRYGEVGCRQGPGHKVYLETSTESSHTSPASREGESGGAWRARAAGGAPNARAANGTGRLSRAANGTGRLPARADHERALGHARRRGLHRARGARHVGRHARRHQRRLVPVRRLVGRIGAFYWDWSHLLQSRAPVAQSHSRGAMAIRVTSLVRPPPLTPSLQ
jgi:hypothetical protein